MAYCAASDITAYGNFATTDAEPLLTLLCARAQAVVDRYTSRTFEEGTAATRYYTGVEDADGDFLLFDVDFLEMATDAAAFTIGSDTITSTNYVLVPTSGAPKYAIRLLLNSPYDWGNQTSDGEDVNNISIKAKWAYSSVCPADIKHACIRLTYWMYKQRETDADLDRPLLTGDGVTIMPSRLPSDVTAILDRYKKLRVA